MARANGKFRGKHPRADASFGGAQWGPEPPSLDAPRTPRPTYGKSAAQLDREIAEALAQQKRSHATIAAPVHHDRLATAIARVVKDPHYWRRGSFDIDDAMQVLPKLQGAYDWQRVLDLVDDYLQGVVGVAGATGGGFPERATRGVGGHEVKAAQAMIQRLRRAGSLHSTQARLHSTKKPKKQLKIYNVDASIIAGNSGEAVWEGSFELPAASKKEAGQRALDILHDSPYYDDRIDPRADFQVWLNYSMSDMTAEDIAQETRAFINSAREKVGASSV